MRLGERGRHRLTTQMLGGSEGALAAAKQSAVGFAAKGACGSRGVSGQVTLRGDGSSTGAMTAKFATEVSIFAHPSVIDGEAHRHAPRL